MSSLLEQIKVYDVECYPNLFMVTLYSYSKDKYYTFSIYPDKDIDERESIVKFYLNKNVIWCGYNNSGYDDAMMHHLVMLCRDKEEVDESFVTDNKLNWNKDAPYYKLNDQWYKVDLDVGVANLTTTELTKQLHEYSSTLIKGNAGKYRKKINIKSIDLLEIIRKGFNVKSLKGVAINLKHHRIQDLPIAPDQNVTPEDFENMQSYNINDVNITKKILEKILPKIEMRSFLNDFYNNEVDLLSESDSGICKKLLTVFYQKKLAEKNVDKYDKRWKFRKRKTVHGDINIADIVYERISFSTTELKEFYDEIKEQTIVKTKSTEVSDNYSWSYTLDFNKNVYSLGLGGIHTEDQPVIYEADDEYITLDCDCTSMYPQSFIYNKLCPEHLDKEIFLEILNDLLAERVKYKKLYKDTKNQDYNNLQAAMKIALNTFFGLTNSKTFWLFDPKATFTCTINNQLLMLMLIEDFTLKGFQVISANTDGITVRIKREQLEPLREAYREWEIMSGFRLEEVFYDKYIRRDVNNYIAVPVGDKPKYKGVFTPQDEKDLLSGFEYPIVAQALSDYFLNKIPVEKTIKECVNIYDFCFSQRCGKQFTNHQQLIDRKEKMRYGKHLEKVYTIPKQVDMILEEKDVQRNLRLFVTAPDLLETPEHELFEGYCDYYSRGYSLKKKKMRETKRYDVVKDEELKKCWWIIDLKTGEKVGESFLTKTSTTDKLAELNAQPNAVVEIEQVSDYVAGKFITLFNDFFAVENFADYKVDYDYYIDLAKAEVDKVEGKFISDSTIKEIWTDRDNVLLN